MKERKREKDVLKQAKQITDGKAEVKLTQKGVQIGSSIYRNKLLAPKPRDLLELSPEELEETLQTKLNKGKQEIVDNNVFLAYGMDVKTHQDVRKGYLKVKLLHAKAKHVVCAYNLPGKELYYCQDYEDDQEHGVGRNILSPYD